MNVATTIMVAAIAQRSFFPGFFEHPVVDYIGKISYPTYIFNLPIVGLMAWLFGRYDIAIAPNSYWFLIVCLIPTFAIAALVHHYIEEPCNRLKAKWFRYEARTPEQKQAARAGLAQYQTPVT